MELSKRDPASPARVVSMKDDESPGWGDGGRHV